MKVWLLVAACSLAFAANRVERPPQAPAPGPAEPGDTRVRSADRKLSLDTLVQSLKDPDEEVRAKAAEDLGRVEPPPVEAVPPLIRALNDGSPMVRHRAAETLERIGTPKARKAVLKYRRKMAREKQGW